MKFLIRINTDKWPVWSAENTPGKFIGKDSFTELPFPTNAFPCQFNSREAAEQFIKQHAGNLLFEDISIISVNGV